MDLLSNAVCVTRKSEIAYYLNIVNDLWETPHTVKFPAPNPIPLDKTNLAELLRDDYLVSLKTDGVRFILLLTLQQGTTTPISLLISRTSVVYKICVWANADFFLKSTLLDGELVKGNDDALHYMIFDAIVAKGKDLKKQCYRERTRIISSLVLEADTRTMEDGCLENLVACQDCIVARDESCVVLKAKKVLPRQQIGRVYRELNGTGHANDGLIFTRNDCGVENGTSKYTFKWKMSHSVDLRVDAHDNLWAHNDKRAGESKLDVDIFSLQPSALSYQAGCIVEFDITFLGSKVLLTPQRVRHDKLVPNSLKTIDGTVKCARDNITPGELIELLGDV